jgi:hypothetical protein
MPDLARSKLVVIAELPCRRCGYALRGCSTAGRCPECGLPVEESIRGAVDLASLESIQSDFAPTRRATWSIPAVAIAGIIGTIAGLILPTAIVLAPTGFDPRGVGGRVDSARAHLESLFVWVGAVTAIAAVVAIVATLVSRWRRHARREAWVAFLGSGLLLVAAGLAVTPGGLGLNAAAEAASRGLGSLIRGGGQTPAPVVLVALAIDGLRALGISFLVAALGDLLQQIGRRSESYTLAGQELQGSKPVMAATGATLIMAGGWLAATATSGLPGRICGMLEAIAWPILWLTAAAVTTLGAGYLAMNAVWATAPWRRPHQRLDELVGPATTGSGAASMADPKDNDRAP